MRRTGLGISIGVIAIASIVAASAHASKAYRPPTTQVKQASPQPRPAPRQAASYDNGKICYQRLKSEPAARKNRARWQECIRIFESLVNNSPSSTDAPKAAYSAARLSRELYGNKHSRSDLDNALRYYNRVAIDYPRSRLADDALYQIAQIRANQMKEPERAKKALRTQIKRYPRGDTTPQAKAMLDRLEGRHQEKKEAKKDTSREKRVYEEPVVEMSYPASSESDVQPASAKDPGELVDVTHKRLDDATMITLHFDRPLAFRTIFEGGEGGRRGASSLEIQLKETHPRKGLRSRIRVNSPTVRSVRVGPRILGGTKVTVALKKGTNYRLVQHAQSIDVIFRKATIASIAPATKGARTAASATASTSPVVASSYKTGGTQPRERKTSLWNRLMPWKKNKHKGKGQLRIVVDPGHGGDEEGAVGPHGIREKDVVLSVAEKLAQDLRRELGAKVWLTRTKDKSVSLEKRYKIAKRKKADLFISVHANASRDKRHRGIETFYLNNASDEAAKKLALRENESWRGQRSDIDTILATMLQNAITDDSRELATMVQTSLIDTMRARHKDIRNRKVRSALFYVLVGTQCPSILVETSFITNPREEMRLADPTYQQELASAITQGVKSYLATRPSAQSSL